MAEIIEGRSRSHLRVLNGNTPPPPPKERNFRGEALVFARNVQDQAEVISVMVAAIARMALAGNDGKEDTEIHRIAKHARYLAEDLNNYVDVFGESTSVDDGSANGSWRDDADRFENGR